MTLTILYFAAVRDLVGVAEETLAVPLGVSTIDDLSRHLRAIHPSLEGRLEYVRFARNEAFASGSDVIVSGDVIALIPPVAGG
ncbi:Molybdenum cofactor biosynthesis protein MoaD / Molybdenum cofactor biosynthesis protein MoaE [Labilithrix luteola]|uniref:Molybdopterin synthase sulfur carrier subunit n=1 Tax=Labilithrix luteola TaxID=1391654 RepID=A0A0K1QBZ2_9BACT|nr:molybdopterin converting factor subunit 1 [Labilithrix luteola]AKV03238.1 Molybdenum cofactor biosynthesis protein MoaD / Molybdenum cofactor biosynthesis protein MoaE [Labilithrix luteola]